jgi:O-antigen/teichoic acid export membrane protein
MMENLRLKVLSGLFWSLLQSSGGKLVSLVLFAILARLLAPSEFGLFAAAMAVLSFVTLFVDQGLTEAIVQRPSITPGVLNTVFFINLSLAAAMFAGLWISAPYVAMYMKMPDLTNVLRGSGFALLLSALGFSQQAMHRRHFHYRWIAICTFISALSGGVVGTVLAFLDFGTWSLVAQGLVATAVNTALLWLHGQWRLSTDFEFKGVQGLFVYGMSKLGTNVLFFAYTRGVELLIAATAGASALGVYLVGAKIYQSLMTTICGAVLHVAHSGFSRIAPSKDAMINGYYNAMTMTSAVVVPAFCLLACVAPEMTLLCFGRRWESSIPIMRAMALLGAVEVLEFYNGTVFNAIGKPHIGFMLLLFKTPAVLAAVWLARDMPLADMVWCYVGVQLIANLPSFFLARRLIGVSIVALLQAIGRFVLACLVASAAVVIARLNLPLGDWPVVSRLALLSGIGVSVYLGFVTLAARHQCVEMVSLIRRSSPDQPGRPSERTQVDTHG